MLSLAKSCSKEPDQVFFKEPVSQKDCKWESIAIDSIILEKTPSSYVGETQIKDKTIHFVDQKLCKIFLFDTAGTFNETVLSVGRGPREINTSQIATSLFTNDQKILVGMGDDFHFFSNDWLNQRKYYIDWQCKQSREEMLKNPKAETNGLYSTINEKFIIKKHGDFIYFPIYSQHPTFNFAFSRYYYNEARTVAKMNINNGKIIEIFGRFAPIFKNYEFIGQFSFLNFDMDKEGNFFLCFEPDSIIYQYDSDFNITKAYGFEGRNMDKDYTETNNRNDFQEVFNIDRAEKGYYTWIRYIDELGMLFRSYQKGVEATSDGLQIYKEGVLLADVDVPKGFKVNGYIHPFVYSSIMVDEFAEEMKIYRFKLN